MIINKIDISKLNPAEYNPRKKLRQGDKEYEKLKCSIGEFGYVEPIIVNKDMTVIGGHQRLQVLKDLGYTEIDCVIIDVDKAKEKALNIALNKISGEWDLPLLKDLLLELKNDTFDVNLTGFTDDELDVMLKDVEPIELGNEEDKSKDKQLCHCPKCGFEFEV